MIRIALLPAAFAAMLVTLLPATPARATNAISYLSNTGSGTVCNLANPCRDVGSAFAATGIYGTILCLNSFDYGSGTVTKTVTIDCSGTSSSMAFTVNGVSISVTVRNVRIDNGYNIIFQNGAALVVENCVFTKTPSGGVFGIDFRPTSPGAELVVTDSQFDTFGDGSSGGGIRVSPQAGASAVAVLKNVTVANSSFGIVADGSASTAGINMTITNSDSHRNGQDGIVATTSPGWGADRHFDQELAVAQQHQRHPRYRPRRHGARRQCKRQRQQHRPRR